MARDARSIFADDDVSIHADVFAEDVTFQNGAGAQATIKAIVQDSYQTIDPDTQTQVTSTKPCVSIRLAQVPWKIKASQTVITRGKTFVVHDVQPNGEGAALVLLE